MASRTTQAVDSVVSLIRSQVASGVLSPGSTLPGEHQLASEFNVSRGIIRRAIGILTESGALLRRPYSRPIVPLPSGKDATGNEVYVWVSHPIGEGPSLNLLKEISKGLSGTNFRLNLREPSRYLGSVVKCEEREFLLSVLDSPNAAAAIIEPNAYSNNEDLFQALVNKGKHLCFVDTPPPDGVHADYVGTCNLTAARGCVEHLIDLGHRQIFCIADSNISPVIQDRIKGFERAMRCAGLSAFARTLVATELPTVPDREVALAGPFARSIKHDQFYLDLALGVVEEIIRSDPKPTAIFACHDVMAFWICALLEGSGIKVPRDMSVVGFDWLARWDSKMSDSLTTASQDFDGFGRHAANLILDRLVGDSPRESRHVLLDAPLVIRSSTANNPTLPTF